MWACIMFTGLYFDKANIAQELSDDLLTDLGLTTNDYNLALSRDLDPCTAMSLESCLRHRLLIQGRTRGLIGSFHGGSFVTLLSGCHTSTTLRICH